MDGEVETQYSQDPNPQVDDPQTGGESQLQRFPPRVRGASSILNNLPW